MEISAHRIKILVLWIWIPIALSASALFYITEPGGLERAISEFQEVGAWLATLYAINWLGPLVMAFLSVTLKDRANRITNRVLSIIFTGLMIVEFSNIFLEPSVQVHQILLVGSTVVAAAYLIFYSWKWSK